MSGPAVKRTFSFIPVAHFIKLSCYKYQDPKELFSADAFT